MATWLSLAAAAMVVFVVFFARRPSRIAAAMARPGALTALGMALVLLLLLNPMHVNASPKSPANRS